MEDYQKISKEDFMKFFRDSEKLNKILRDYSVSNLEVIEIENGEK